MNNVPTLESAPRDLVGLTDLGAFVQRRLAESLLEAGFPLWNDDKGKTAFVTSGAEQRAVELEKTLKAYDEKNGKKPSKIETKVEIKTEEKPAEEKKIRRSPQTSNTQPAKETNGVTYSGNSSGGSSDGVQAILLALKALDVKVEALAREIFHLRGARDEDNASHVQMIEQLKATLGEIGQLGIAQVGILSLYGEQVLSAPKEAFLTEAMQYGQDAIKVLEASEGKD